jgi:hypothetical protein
MEEVAGPSYQDRMPLWLNTRNVRHRLDKSKIDWDIENCASGRAPYALHDALENKFAFTPKS